MPVATAAGHGFGLTVAYPAAGWHAAPRLVPALRSPRELHALSNRPLRPLPLTSDQNTPDVARLGPEGCLIWIYYEVLGDPAIDDPAPPPIPDYGRFSYPLDYAEAQVFGRRDYEWGTGLSWRRVGHNLPPVPGRPEPAALTVMTWSGARVPPADLRAVRDIVSSVRLRGHGEVTPDAH